MLWRFNFVLPNDDLKSQIAVTAYLKRVEYMFYSQKLYIK